MSKDKNHRPPTAAELASELAAVEIAQGRPCRQFLIRGEPVASAGGMVPTFTRLPDIAPRASEPQPVPARHGRQRRLLGELPTTDSWRAANLGLTGVMGEKTPTLNPAPDAQSRCVSSDRRQSQRAALLPFEHPTVSWALIYARGASPGTTVQQCSTDHSPVTGPTRGSMNRLFIHACVIPSGTTGPRSCTGIASCRKRTST